MTTKMTLGRIIYLIAQKLLSVGFLVWALISAWHGDMQSFTWQFLVSSSLSIHSSLGLLLSEA